MGIKEHLQYARADQLVKDITTKGNIERVKREVRERLERNKALFEEFLARTPLRESFNELVREEHLEDATIEVDPVKPDGSIMDLVLSWKKKSSGASDQEGVLVSPRNGLYMITAESNLKGGSFKAVRIRGNNEELATLLKKRDNPILLKDGFDAAIVRAYLNPRWVDDIIAA